MANICWTVFIFFFMQITSISSQSDLPGHLQPLGSHCPPTGGVEIRMTFPSPEEFFSDYIEASKPVLFKGVMENGFLPAYSLWTDEYLRKTYGQDSVDVEFGKKEARQGETESFSMSSFLDAYEKENIYMVNDISANMAKDVNLPKCIVCGGLAESIFKVIMWFSSGGTKSVLHNDSYDNINCLLDGEKYFVMINRNHSDLIESKHWRNNGAYHTVDVEKVDMIKYPELQHVTWYEVKMKKGDCLFIPFQWYHHVDSSSKGRNIAVNFWFHHGRPFNKTDCKGVDLDEQKPLNTLKLSADPESVRDELMEMVSGDEDTVNENQFMNNMLTYQKLDKITIKKLFEHIDLNNDQTLSAEEIETFDAEDALKTFPVLRIAMVPSYQAMIENDSNVDLKHENKEEEMSKSNFNIHEEL